MKKTTAVFASAKQNDQEKKPIAENQGKIPEK